MKVMNPGTLGTPRRFQELGDLSESSESQSSSSSKLPTSGSSKLVLPPSPKQARKNIRAGKITPAIPARLKVVEEDSLIDENVDGSHESSDDESESESDPGEM